MHYLPTQLQHLVTKLPLNSKLLWAKITAKHKLEIQKWSFTIYNYVEAKLCSPCHWYLAWVAKRIFCDPPHIDSNLTRHILAPRTPIASERGYFVWMGHVSSLSDFWWIRFPNHGKLAKNGFHKCIGEIPILDMKHSDQKINHVPHPFVRNSLISC